MKIEFGEIYKIGKVSYLGVRSEQDCIGCEAKGPRALFFCQKCKKDGMILKRLIGQPETKDNAK